MEIVNLIIENQALIIPAIMGLLSSVVTVATVISKLTKNETDNKWVLIASKVIQVFAIHATPTTGKRK